MFLWVAVSLVVWCLVLWCCMLVADGVRDEHVDEDQWVECEFDHEDGDEDRGD